MSSSPHSPQCPPEPTGVDAKEDQNTLVAADDDVSHARTPDSMDSVEIALLDEEEIPDEFEDAIAGPPEMSARSGASGPGYTSSGGYNALKSFKGQVYSGMSIGGFHTWNYDQGVWKETKEEPDLWKINFETTKRRARNAPKGSGAPVGTEYRWLIVAHQVSFSAAPEKSSRGMTC